MDTNRGVPIRMFKECGAHGTPRLRGRHAHENFFPKKSYFLKYLYEEIENLGYISMVPLF